MYASTIKKERKTVINHAFEPKTPLRPPKIKVKAIIIGFNLRKALNTYKEYSASVEIQFKQLKSENEQLRYKYNNAVSQLDEYKKKQYYPDQNSCHVQHLKAAQ